MCFTVLFCQMVEGMWPLFEFYWEDLPAAFRLYSAASFQFFEGWLQLATLI